jgi:hypothetical protein
MTTTKLWKVIEEGTTGWELAEAEGCRKLTKEQARVKLNELMNQGRNPNRLRAIPDND